LTDCVWILICGSDVILVVKVFFLSSTPVDNRKN